MSDYNIEDQREKIEIIADYEADMARCRAICSSNIVGALLGGLAIGMFIMWMLMPCQ